MHRSRPLGALALALTAASRAADAEEPAKLAAPESEYLIETNAGDARRQGVDWRLETAATFTLSDNRSVVGQPDGTTVLFGLKTDAIVVYNRAAHEWRNTMSLGEGLARTPLVDELVKSRDALSHESIYLYHLLPWVGPFARASVSGPLFRGTDVRPDVTAYQIALRSGATEVRAADRLVLTDPLRPLALKESLGAFFRPLARDAVNLELRLGVGARETLADGQLAIDDDAETPAVEVKELYDVHQLGAETAAEIWGALSDKRVSYRATAEAMTPLAHTDLPRDDDRDLLDLTNIALSLNVSCKIVAWASLDYELKAVREPQLLDAFQVQHNLLLTLGVSAGNLPKGKQ